MSKQVLVRLDGLGVYEGLEEAAAALQVAPASVSRAIRDSGAIRGVQLKWVDRVYAVKEKGGDWKVVVMNSRNTAYLPVSQVGPAIKPRMVEAKKDLTQVWYGTVFAGRDTQ